MAQTVSTKWGLRVREKCYLYIIKRLSRLNFSIAGLWPRFSLMCVTSPFVTTRFLAVPVPGQFNLGFKDQTVHHAFCVNFLIGQPLSKQL